MKRTFISRSSALKKGFKTKQGFVSHCNFINVKVQYSGKTIIDSDGNILKEPGFYVN